MSFGEGEGVPINLIKDKDDVQFYVKYQGGVINSGTSGSLIFEDTGTFNIVELDERVGDIYAEEDIYDMSNYESNQVPQDEEL